MIRKLLVLATLLLAVPPAAALASNTTNDVTANASKHCATLRVKIGVTSFGQTFSSFGACVSSLAPLERQNSSTAATSCRGEQADMSFASTHRGKTFARLYGTGSTSKNAFGKCVSIKASNSARAQIAAEVSATTVCQTEQADTSFASSHGGTMFAQFYGTGDDSNAFGKCVAQKAHLSVAVQQPQPEPVTPVTGCGPKTGGPPQPMAASCLVAKTN